MNGDESFDREVRATLEGLAREPAPERLVASVAAIPETEPAAEPLLVRVRHSGRGVVSGFAALAAVLALAVAAILLRPGSVPPVGESPSAAVVPSASAPSSETPSTASPVAQVSPTPTATPTVKPTPTHVAAGAPVPAGFRPMSVTFISSSKGWVLGSAPCATGRCPAIARTVDGGKTWTSIDAPDTTIGSEPSVDVSGTGVVGLRFANTLDGWAFGPELWSTHDGGTTWTRIQIAPGASVLALGSGNGSTHTVVYENAQDYHIVSSPIGSDNWTTSAVTIPVGGGPVPEIQLVLSGSAGWVLENDRTVVGGARLVGGTWRTWQPACSDVVGPAFIDASGPSDLAAACDVGQWSTPQGEHLYVSRDAGVTFTETGVPTPLDTASGLATPGRSTILIAGLDKNGTAMVGSFDGGHTWARVFTSATVSLNDLGFTTAAQGVVVSTAANGSSHLFMTHDGGRTWAAVTF